MSVFFLGDEQSVKGEIYGAMMDGQEMEKAFKDHDIWYFIRVCQCSTHSHQQLAADTQVMMYKEY